jgi:phospholipase B1
MRRYWILHLLILTFNFNGTTSASVHSLRPGDIDLVMALGDSVTAGLFADDSIYELRGISFATGGNDSLSLANLIRLYNPNVKGCSFGAHIVEPPMRLHFSDWDRLNAAQSKATVQDLMGQVNYLIGELLSGKYGIPERVMEKMWKHLNVFIGANNLCDACQGRVENGPMAYDVAMREVLEYVYQKIPRVVVSLVSLPKLSYLRKLQPLNGWCKTVHEYAECRCVFNGTDEDIALVDYYTDRINQNLRVIRSDWVERMKQENINSFAVLLHPFNEDAVIPSENLVSKLDCFHPSLIGHANFAMGIWNSLFLPFSKKTTAWDFNSDIYFPEKDEFIQVF